MKLLLLFYLIITLFLSATRLSLLNRKKLKWLAILMPGLICLGFFNFSLTRNNQMLDWLLKQDNLVSGIAILLTFEAILVIFLTVVQIKSYYKIGKYPNLWKWISIIPSFQLIASLIFLQTYLFLKVSGYSFILLAFSSFLVSSIILGILTLSIQKIIKKWGFRAELQSLTALFQLLLSMFLPLIARGQSVHFTQITVDYFAILFVILLVITLSLTGYFIYKNKNNRQI